MPRLSDLRICFLAGTLGQGGAERQLYYIAQALAEAGSTVHVLSLTKDEFWEPRLRDLGVSVHWIGGYSRLQRLSSIVQELRRLRPDVVQSQHFYMNAYAAVAARLLNLQEIGAIRSDGQSELRDSGHLIGALSFRLPRLLAANSQVAIRNLTNRGIPHQKLFLLPNAVDLDKFSDSNVHSPQSTSPQHNDQDSSKRVTVMAIGRMGPEKRFDRLLKAAAKVKQKIPNPFYLRLVGDGPDRASLEWLATSLNLLPHEIEFCGRVADVTLLYQSADVLALTSDWEGTPNVILEGMASGLPILATRVGGVPDLVAHGYTGILVDPEDEEDLVAGLGQLIQDLALRRSMGNAGRDRVESQYSVERLPHYLACLYQTALKQEVVL